MLWIFAALGALVWIAILLLPWRPWSTQDSFESKDENATVALDDITVLIPARNEENEIPLTLSALNEQSESSTPRVVLVDDQSEDKTVEKARGVFNGSLIILKGKPLPGDWTGKLYALEQGLKEVKTPYTLLLDADIQLQPKVLPSLKAKMESENLDYLSLMAELRMKNFWEKLLLPAYIFFFKLLYPFSLANKPKNRAFSGAGGCVLIKTSVLKKVGAFSSLRNAIIDDCELAKQVKRSGHKIWIGLTHEIKSHRSYDKLSEIWSLVSRTAYTFLRYNPLLLTGTMIVLLSLFGVLPFFVWLPELSLNLRLFLLVGLLSMWVVYAPIIRFYRVSPVFLALFPIAGLLYSLMVLSSAYQYYRGKRSHWKGRDYSRHDISSNEELKKAS